MLNLKLGTQAQTGVPVSDIWVLASPPPKRFLVPAKPEVTSERTSDLRAQKQQSFSPIGIRQSNGVNELKDSSIVRQTNKKYIEIF